jgi:hypothetical protein
MAKTSEQLATRALGKLLVFGSGQSPDSEDQQAAEAVIPAVFADLEDRGIFTVQDVDDIQLSAFEWLAEVLAMALATDFGQTMDVGRRQFAESQLIRIVSSRPSKEPLAVDHF